MEIKTVTFSKVIKAFIFHFITLFVFTQLNEQAQASLMFFWWFLISLQFIVGIVIMCVGSEKLKFQKFLQTKAYANFSFISNFALCLQFVYFEHLIAAILFLISYIIYHSQTVTIK
ncbi:hypothetical protein MHD_05500 [Mannheimia granulomatis]|uniref:Uncharacterized protein n=1 Tax=Mannheimia granulomatis TaxID=85402 RepID=A0A011MGN1_9PAST|nr:hypothetical protein [Mannheimia granulomatis]EXI61661.1 hypothetical protein AK33_08715 [Mannheimia granulomatis]RGE48555.1 hypothetical protein MHD_05500 [Mannheimia granulomatis]